MLLPLPAVAPPLLVSYGGAETAEFRRQSDDMLGRWRRARLRAELFPQPGRNHFTAMTDLMEREAPLTRAVARFVRG